MVEPDLSFPEKIGSFSSVEAQFFCAFFMFSSFQYFFTAGPLGLFSYQNTGNFVVLKSILHHATDPFCTRFPALHAHGSDWPFGFMAGSFAL